MIVVLVLKGEELLVLVGLAAGGAAITGLWESAVSPPEIHTFHQGPKRLTVSAEGVVLAEALITDTAPRRIAVPLGATQGGELRLDLDCGVAANLSALGLGADARDLGVMLLAATLEREAP